MKSWKNLSVEEKVETTINTRHAAPIECALCGVIVMPAEMRKHRVRCRGPDVPHEADTWESKAEAAGRGLPLSELVRLVTLGAIRERSGSVLTRDVERALMAREVLRLG